MVWWTSIEKNPVREAFIPRNIAVTEKVQEIGLMKPSHYRQIVQSRTESFTWKTGIQAEAQLILFLPYMKVLGLSSTQ